MDNERIHEMFTFSSMFVIVKFAIFGGPPKSTFSLVSTNRRKQLQFNWLWMEKIVMKIKMLILIINNIIIIK